MEIGDINILGENTSSEVPATIGCKNGIVIHSTDYISISANKNSLHEVFSVENDKVYVEKVRIPKIVCGNERVDSNKSTFIDYSFANFSSIPHVIASWATENGNIAGNWGTLKVSLKSNNGCTVIAGGEYPKSPQSFDWIAIGY